MIDFSVARAICQVEHLRHSVNAAGFFEGLGDHRGQAMLQAAFHFLDDFRDWSASMLAIRLTTSTCFWRPGRRGFQRPALALGGLG